MSAEEGAKPYQVLLASARPELAAAWRRLLGAEPGITLQAASAGDGRALVHHLANGSCPDVLLLDHSLLGQLGPAELDAMQRRLETLRVLLLCDEPGVACAATVLRHRFHGYLPTECPPGLCAKAIRTVRHGDIWLPRALLAQALAELLHLHPAAPPQQPGDGPLRTLTRRERQIVEHLRRGCTNKEIALALGIMEDTVKKHLQSVFSKLGVHRRTLVAMGSQ